MFFGCFLSFLLRAVPCLHHWIILMFSHWAILIYLYCILLTLQMDFFPHSKRCCDFINTFWPWLDASDICSKTYFPGTQIMTLPLCCAVLGCVWRANSNATKGQRHLTAFLTPEVWKTPLSCLAPMLLPKTFPTARHRELPNLESDKQIS